jgi:hypothetical protein
MTNPTIALQFQFMQVDEIMENTLFSLTPSPRAVDTHPIDSFVGMTFPAH